MAEPLAQEGAPATTDTDFAEADLLKVAAEHVALIYRDPAASRIQSR